MHAGIQRSDPHLGAAFQQPADERSSVYVCP